MNEYLLDTQTLLNWDADLPVGAAAAAIVSDENNTLYISHASVWEIAIKTQLGKLTLPKTLESWVCHRSLQSVPPAVESKCTTSGRLYSRLGRSVFARTVRLFLSRYAEAACCCSP